jgi:hypothetical protein
MFDNKIQNKHQAFKCFSKVNITEKQKVEKQIGLVSFYDLSKILYQTMSKTSNDVI